MKILPQIAKDAGRLMVFGATAQSNRKLSANVKASQKAKRKGGYQDPQQQRGTLLKWENDIPKRTPFIAHSEAVIF